MTHVWVVIPDDCLDDISAFAREEAAEAFAEAYDGDAGVYALDIDRGPGTCRCGGAMREYVGAGLRRWVHVNIGPLDDTVDTPDGWDHVAEPVMIERGVNENTESECLHCGHPVIDGSGAVVRCEMCGPFCCEDHHRRHPSYARHDIAPDVVLTGVRCDGCAHPESLHDERIRTVGDGVAPCSTCAVCIAVHTGDPEDDEPGIEEYDHSRAKEDARNARYRQ